MRLRLLWTVAILLATPVAAQNLIPNPGFDTDLSGWTGGPAVWSPEDQSGDPGSGSARVDVPSGVLFALFSSCIPLVPGDDVVFGAAVRTLDGVPAAGAGTGIRYFTNGTCSYPSDSTSYLTDLGAGGGRTGWGTTQTHAVVPPGMHSAEILITLLAGIEPPTTFYLDNAYFYAGASCATTTNVACLADSRFRVTADWETPAGQRGYAGVRPLSGDSTYLWFFDDSNLELVLKVLDGCGFNDRYWVYAAGLTNLGVELQVFDSLTGESWTYDNPVDLAFPPRQDIEAFATCDVGP
ncbi:MAG: hypothetical protein AB7G12_08165 [Thermoanaerobaculia bacterium]